MKYLSVVKDFNFRAPGVPFCQCQCFEMQLFNVWVVQDSDLTTTHPSCSAVTAVHVQKRWHLTNEPNNTTGRYKYKLQYMEYDDFKR